MPIRRLLQTVGNVQQSSLRGCERIASEVCNSLKNKVVKIQFGDSFTTSDNSRPIALRTPKYDLPRRYREVAGS